MNHRETMFVANRAQQALMVCELQGQISDGHWENSVPMNHWEGPTMANVVIDPDNLGYTGRRRRTYAFNNSELYDIVGDRMRIYASFATAYPNLSLEVIRTLDCPNWAWDTSAEYRSTIEDNFKVNTLEGLRKFVNEFMESFAMTDEAVRKELKELSRIFKMDAKVKS